MPEGARGASDMHAGLVSKNWGQDGAGEARTDPASHVALQTCSWWWENLACADGMILSFFV